MSNQRILLTVNKELFEELKKGAKSNYMNIQEFINNILRNEIIKRKR